MPASFFVEFLPMLAADRVHAMSRSAQSAPIVRIPESPLNRSKRMRQRIVFFLKGLASSKGHHSLLARPLRLLCGAVMLMALASCEDGGSRADRETDPAGQSGERSQTKRERGIAVAENPELAAASQRGEQFEVETEPGIRMAMTIEEMQAMALDSLADHPEVAERLLKQLPLDSAERPALMQALVARYLQEGEDPNRLYEWISRMPALDDRMQVTRMILPSLPEPRLAEDAPRLMSLLLTTGTQATQEEPDPAVDSFFRRWAHADPAGSADWSSRLAKPEERHAWLSQSLGQWIREDAASALTWADGHRPELRQTAEAIFIQSLAGLPQAEREAAMEHLLEDVRKDWQQRVDEIHQELNFTDPDSEPE